LADVQILVRECTARQLLGYLSREGMIASISAVPALFGQGLAGLDGCVEGSGDAGDDIVDSFGNILEASDGCDGNEADYQSILDQILTLLAAHQVLELHIELEKHGVHLCSPRRLISTSL